MVAISLASPLPYEPGVETTEKDEAATGAALTETVRGIMQTTYEDYGHAVRSVHAERHAMPRGLAIKVIGVEGERPPGSEGDATQDFIMVNGPAFTAANTRAFKGSLKLLAATTDAGQGWRKAFSAALHGAEAGLEALGGKSPAVLSMRGPALTHPLGETFYTQTPFRYGDHIAKVSAAPASPWLKALTGAPVDLAGKPNGLREVDDGLSFSPWHGLAAGVTPKLWKDAGGSIAQHGLLHAPFGITTALVADRVARRL